LILIHKDKKMGNNKNSKFRKENFSGIDGNNIVFLASWRLCANHFLFFPKDLIRLD